MPAILCPVLPLSSLEGVFSCHANTIRSLFTTLFLFRPLLFTLSFYFTSLRNKSRKTLNNSQFIYFNSNSSLTPTQHSTTLAQRTRQTTTIHGHSQSIHHLLNPSTPDTGPTNTNTITCLLVCLFCPDSSQGIDRLPSIHAMLTKETLLDVGNVMYAEMTLFPITIPISCISCLSRPLLSFPVLSIMVSCLGFSVFSALFISS